MKSHEKIRQKLNPEKGELEEKLRMQKFKAGEWNDMPPKPISSPSGISGGDVPPHKVQAAITTRIGAKPVETRGEDEGFEVRIRGPQDLPDTLSTDTSIILDGEASRTMQKPPHPHNGSLRIDY